MVLKLHARKAADESKSAAKITNANIALQDDDMIVLFLDLLCCSRPGQEIAVNRIALLLPPKAQQHL